MEPKGVNSLRSFSSSMVSSRFLIYKFTPCKHKYTHKLIQIIFLTKNTTTHTQRHNKAVHYLISADSFLFELFKLPLEFCLSLHLFLCSANKHRLTVKLHTIHLFHSLRQKRHCFCLCVVVLVCCLHMVYCWLWNKLPFGDNKLDLDLEISLQ